MVSRRTPRDDEETCDWCGKLLTHWHIGFGYCSSACWFYGESRPWYREWMEAQREARLALKGVLRVRPGHVITFRDGDPSNRALSNLTVYRSEQDRLDAHRGLPVQPLWDGSGGRPPRRRR